MAGQAATACPWPEGRCARRLKNGRCLMELCSTGRSWRLQTVAFPFGAVSRQIETAGYDRTSGVFQSAIEKSIWSKAGNNPIHQNQVLAI